MKKKIILALVLVVVAGLAGLAWTFSAARLEFTPLAADSLPHATPPLEMTISALPTGSMESKALFAYRGGSLSDTREFTMTAILVRHPKGDLLFDTGFGRNLEEHTKAMPWLMKQLAAYKKGTAVGDQLDSGGYPAAKLAGVVLTHAHWDHVSGLDSLPPVPVWINAAERGFVSEASPLVQLINSFENVNFSTYGFEGGPYLGFPASHDVWGDGSIVLVPAPGHTPGSIVVFLTLPRGTRYALLGDLVWQSEGIDLPAERPWLSRRLVHEDDAGVRENIARIAAIHARFPEMHMIPAHDGRASAGIPVFPATTH